MLFRTGENADGTVADVPSLRSPSPTYGTNGATMQRQGTAAGSKTSQCRRQSAAVNGGLPRFSLCWFAAVLLSHVCYVECLSEMRHQLGEAANDNTITDQFRWSSTAPWTACSNTCGYGIQYQDRSCLNQRNEVADARFCLGSARKYKVCITDTTQCPGYYAEFLTRECTQNDESLRWSARRVGGCQFACYGVSRMGRRYTTASQWMPDGMLCTRHRGCDWWSQGGALPNGVCLQGQCLDVGCDGYVNSTKVQDSCGVCGGDSTSCQVVTAEFTEILQVGYTEVIDIPAGAHNIRIYETSPNFLAIMDEMGTIVFNADFQIAKPGRHEVAGMYVNYRRCGGSQYRPSNYEELTIEEPIASKIIISVVSAHMNSEARAAYQYSLPLPPEEKPPQTTAGPTTSTTQDTPVPTNARTTQMREDKLVQLTTAARRSQDNIMPAKSDSVTPPSTDDQPTSFLQEGPGSSEHSGFLETPKSTSSEKSNFNRNTSSGGKSLENPSIPIAMFSETAETLFEDALDVPSPVDPPRTRTHLESERDDLLEMSGQFEDRPLSTTTESTLVYSSENSIFASENNDTTVDTQPRRPLIPKDQTNSPKASKTPNPSPTSGKTTPLENRLFAADEFEETLSSSPTYESSRPEESSSLEPIFVPTSASFVPPRRTIEGEQVDGLRDFHRADSPELLFGEFPQVMELINPSRESQDLAAQPSAAQPSAAASTSIVISRGDVPWEEQQVKPRYLWARTGVAPCSSTCSRGMSRSYAYCTNRGEQVSDTLCDPASKPIVVERECGGKPCEPRWASGSWSQCTVSCDTGSMYRTVHCWLMIAPGLDTSITNSYCNQSNIPDSVRSCSLDPCGPLWQTSDWSECSQQCGDGVQTREVRCSVEGGNCNTSKKPPATKTCRLRSCPSRWTTSQWNMCRNRCALQFRRVDCVNQGDIIVDHSACSANEKPLSKRLCGENCPAQWVPQSFGPCQGQCGSTTRQRKVVCGRTTQAGGMQVLANSVCTAQKPATETNCQLVNCQRQAIRHRRQMPQWLTTPWSVCSVTCGRGQRTRKVTCNRRRNQNNLNCNQSKKPATSEPCAMGECPPVSPVCSDTSTTANCNVIRRANLCRYASYKRSCCLSCSP